MKNKKLSKKLTLRKHTVSNLDEKQLDAIQGGITTKSFYLSVCDTVCRTDCSACPTDPDYNTCCGSMPQGCSC